MSRYGRFLALIAVVITVGLPALSPAPASASLIGDGCAAGGLISGIIGKICTAATHIGGIASAGKSLLGGHLGGAAKDLLGGSSTVAKRLAPTVIFVAIGGWIAKGASAALKQAATVISNGTRPQLGAAWFSETYWRVAGLAVVLTLPFLFAAAIQALVRSDLALLTRAAFGYLPAAMLLIFIVAPVTELLLNVSDFMSSFVSAAAGNGETRFLADFVRVVAFSHAIGGSTFLLVLSGIVIVLAGLALSLELLLREAAVYVVVMMLPLAFAAMVWPARRVWAARTVEVLVSLILSKFVIVAVLALAGAALGQLGSAGVGTVMAGMALLILATFSPWALMRLLPMTEIAAGAVGAMRAEVPRLHERGQKLGDHALGAAGSDVSEWPGMLTAAMRETLAGPPRTDDAASSRGRSRQDGGNSNASAAEATQEPSEPGNAIDSDAVADGEASIVGVTAAGGTASRQSQAATVGTDEPGFRAGAGDGAISANGSADSAPGESAGTENRAEGRLPGMERGWQTDDQTWHPLTLGLPDEASRDPWAGEPAEDDDPRPEPQPPQDGPL
jgi:hypothetical protein